jgi:hypothetical protein
VPTVNPGSRTIRLRPILALRINNFIGAVAIAAAGAAGVWGGYAVGFTAHQGWILSALGLPFALYGLVMAPASLRLGLILSADHAVVRGYFRTVRIPRQAITRITSYPGIVWTDLDGRERDTLVNSMNVYRSGRARPSEKLLARISDQTAVLSQWAAVD